MSPERCATARAARARRSARLVGDLVVSRLRPYLRQIALVHPSAVAHAEGRPLALSTEFYVLAPRVDGEDLAFLVPFLLSADVQRALAGAQEGGITRAFRAPRSSRSMCRARSSARERRPRAPSPRRWPMPIARRRAGEHCSSRERPVRPSAATRDMQHHGFFSGEALARAARCSASCRGAHLHEKWPASPPTDPRAARCSCDSDGICRWFVMKVDDESAWLAAAKQVHRRAVRGDAQSRRLGCPRSDDHVPSARTSCSRAWTTAASRSFASVRSSSSTRSAVPIDGTRSGAVAAAGGRRPRGKAMLVAGPSSSDVRARDDPRRLSHSPRPRRRPRDAARSLRRGRARDRRRRAATRIDRRAS